MTRAKAEVAKSSDKVLKLPKKQQREPFIPLTGNPEIHDYGDWERHLREGRAAPLTKSRK